MVVGADSTWESFGARIHPPFSMSRPFLRRKGRKTHKAAGRQEQSPAGAIDTGVKTFHEWLTDRSKNDGLWLDDKSAVVGMLNINPLLQKKAKVKPLKLPKSKLDFGATPKPFKAMVLAVLSHHLLSFHERRTYCLRKARTLVRLSMSHVELLQRENARWQPIDSPCLLAHL
jgi:hypothetical protein